MHMQSGATTCDFWSDAAESAMQRSQTVVAVVFDAYCSQRQVHVQMILSGMVICCVLDAATQASAKDLGSH